MLSREEIYKGIDKSGGDVDLRVKAAIGAQLDVLLDIRDLLAAKRPYKTVSTDVPLSDKEQTLLNNLQSDER